MREKYASSFSFPLIGYILSLVLIFAASYLVTHKVLSGLPLLIAVLGLALCQIVIQLIFFYFIGFESQPRWNVLTLIFMVAVVAIVVTGSIWIMYNINYHIGLHSQ